MPATKQFSSEYFLKLWLISAALLLPFSTEGSELRRILQENYYQGFVYHEAEGQVKFRSRLQRLDGPGEASTVRPQIYRLRALENVLLAQLALFFASQGELDFNAAVGDLLELDFPEKLVYGGEALRVRHLLTNQAGVSAAQTFMSQHPKFWQSDHERLARILADGLDDKPGHAYSDPAATRSLLTAVLTRVAPNSLKRSLTELLARIGAEDVYFDHFPAERFDFERVFRSNASLWIFDEQLFIDRKILGTDHDGDLHIYSDSVGIAKILKWQLFNRQSVLNFYNKDWNLASERYFGGFRKRQQSGQDYFELYQDAVPAGIPVFALFKIRSSQLLFLISSQSLMDSTLDQVRAVFTGRPTTLRWVAEIKGSLNWFYEVYLGSLILAVLAVTVVLDFLRLRFAKFAKHRVIELLPSLFPMGINLSPWFLLNFVLTLGVGISFYMSLPFTVVSMLGMSLVLLLVVKLVRTYIAPPWLGDDSAVAISVYAKEAVFILLAVSCFFANA